MAQSPSLQSVDHWILPQGWGWAGHSDSTSPASSSDSLGSCPCDGARGPSQPAPQARGARAADVAPTAPGRARPSASEREKLRMRTLARAADVAPTAPGRARQSASEREKLRMRTLARALHALRRFLPPSVAPAGQSLTKIETLRLAIRYIGHLSAVLGLSEESLRRQRRRHGDAALPGGCPLCPDGGPAQGLDSAAAAAAAGSWGSPPACSGAPAAPERLGSRVPDMGPWVTTPCYSGMQLLPQASQGRTPDAPLWTPPQACSGTQTPPQPLNQARPWTPAPELAAVYQGIPVSPESYLLPETPLLLPGPACQRLQPQTQWGYWSHSAEMPPSSEEQGLGHTLQLSNASPLQSSGLQLSGCPELWEEDLEGGHLGIFYQ